jgi:L-ascorbate metabolism protein UlaG (beta-lactamase superfamily)
MVITYHGGGCFKITSGKVTILIDPESHRFKGDVILRTQSPASDIPYPSVDIVGAGEYEIKGVEITGYSLTANKTIQTAYFVKSEEMTLAFLGNPQKLPEAGEWEKSGPVDILFLAPPAAKAIKMLNPKIAVPAFVKNSKEAAKAFDQKVEELDKLTVKKKDLGEKLRIVALKNA